MAWMFAATEQDMTAGMHLHYHYMPTPAGPVPTPFYPHPAIGFIKDKLCSSVKADNRKAAKTGAKTKILLPPHLPLLGPLCTGVPKENTGIQQVWMGAGIGVHPFGGIGFVVLEGKPAAGMLSNCMGCWSVAPGTDMMLPFVGLDFVMIPTRAVTVLYGPAPLAMDLFVLLLSLLRDLFDFILSKVPDGFWKDVLEIAFDSLMEGAEVFCDAIEQGKSPGEALKMAASATAFAFVDKSMDKVLDFAAGKVLGAGDKLIDGAFGKMAGGDGWAAKGKDFLLDVAKDTTKELFHEGVGDLKKSLKDGAMGQMDKWTGGTMTAGEKAIADKNSRFEAAEAPNPVLGPLEGPLENVGVAANQKAMEKKEAWDKAAADEKAAKQQQADAKKVLNDPNATPEQKAQAKQDFKAAQDAKKEAEFNKQKAMKESQLDQKFAAEDFTKKVAAETLKEGKKDIAQATNKELGFADDSVFGKGVNALVDKGVDKGAGKIDNVDAKKQAEMDAWQAQKKKDAAAKNDNNRKQQALDNEQQKKQAEAGLDAQNKKDAAKDQKNQAAGEDPKKAAQQEQAKQEQAKKDNEKAAKEKQVADNKDKIKQVYADRAKNDEAAASKHEGYAKSWRKQEADHQKAIDDLKAQKAATKDPRQQEFLDKEIAHKEKAKENSAKAAEEQEIWAKHYKARAKDNKGTVNNEGYVGARAEANDIPGTFQPAIEGMDPADKKRIDELNAR